MLSYLKGGEYLAILLPGILLPGGFCSLGESGKDFGTFSFPFWTYTFAVIAERVLLPRT